MRLKKNIKKSNIKSIVKEQFKKEYKIHKRNLAIKQVIKEEVERGFNEGANDDEFEMMDKIVDALGPQKALEELIQGLPSDTVREMLSFIARNYDIPMEMDEETKPHEADRTQGRDVPEDRIRN